jgi:hypothetical protein
VPKGLHKPVHRTIIVKFWLPKSTHHERAWQLQRIRRTWVPSPSRMAKLLNADVKSKRVSMRR